MSTSITLREFSKLSGYSISTISKALNGKPQVSDDTREKIIELADSYKYFPNKHAKSLRTNKTHIIALIVPKINSKFFGGIISYIQRRAFEQNFRLIVLESTNNNIIEKECLNKVNDGTVDGVICVRYSGDNLCKSEPFELYDKNIPIIISEVNFNLQVNIIGENLFNKLMRGINKDYKKENYNS